MSNFEVSSGSRMSTEMKEPESPQSVTEESPVLGEFCYAPRPEDRVEHAATPMSWELPNEHVACNRQHVANEASEGKNNTQFPSLSDNSIDFSFLDNFEAPLLEAFYDPGDLSLPLECQPAALIADLSEDKDDPFGPFGTPAYCSTVGENLFGKAPQNMTEHDKERNHLYILEHDRELAACIAALPTGLELEFPTLPTGLDLEVPSLPALRVAQPSAGPATTLQTPAGLSMATEAVKSLGGLQFRHDEQTLTKHFLELAANIREVDSDAENSQLSRQ